MMLLLFALLLINHYGRVYPDGGLRTIIAITFLNHGAHGKGRLPCYSRVFCAFRDSRPPPAPPILKGKRGPRDLPSTRFLLNLSKEDAMEHPLITSHPAVLGGKPVIKGTRIAVSFILKLFSSGWTMDQILENYPHLTREGVLAALEYAADVLEGERVVPLSEATQP
jgi:uncharacterized protein (DUF433 family)